MSIPRQEEPETGDGGHPDPAFAACLTGSDQQSLMDRERYTRNRNSSRCDNEEEKREERRMAIAQQLAVEAATDAAEFFYKSTEAERYSDFISDEDWLNFADEAEDDLFRDTEETVMVDTLTGNIIVGRLDAEGLPAYYKMTDNGPQRIYDRYAVTGDIPEGAETFDGLMARRVYNRPGENGDTEFVTARGELLDKTVVEKLQSALNKNGMAPLEQATCEHEKLIQHKEKVETVEQNESSLFAIGDDLKSARNDLAKNYTPENFLKVQELDIENKRKGLDAKRDAGKTTLDDDIAEDKLNAEARDLQKLQAEINGKTPEEANALLSKTYGDIYDLARAGGGSNPSYAEARTGMNASRGGPSVIASPFNSAANPGTQPAPQLSPDFTQKPEWNRNNAGAFAPGAPFGAQAGG